jgi:hypothetical protein
MGDRQMAISKQFKALVLTAATVVAATCVSVTTTFQPATRPTAKPVVIAIAGFNEKVDESHLLPLADALVKRGYEVRLYRWYDHIDIPPHTHRIGIGYSFGGDTLTRLTFAYSFDKIILVDPVRQGDVFKQGEPLIVSRSVPMVVVYTRDNAIFPKPSPIQTSGDTVVESYKVNASHGDIVERVQDKILSIFP